MKKIKKNLKWITLVIVMIILLGGIIIKVSLFDERTNNIVIEELELQDVYYYDIINDKAQANSNYYELIELLDGYLITTDISENNLLAPSLYIIDKGKVKYYNIETSAMKNTDKVNDYWTEEKEIEFKTEISDAINKYYLNKQEK